MGAAQKLVCDQKSALHRKQGDSTYIWLRVTLMYACQKPRGV